jgi:hypothetical protein
LLSRNAVTLEETMVNSISQNGTESWAMRNLEMDLDKDGKNDFLLIKETIGDDGNKTVTFGAILTATNKGKPVDENFLKRVYHFKMSEKKPGSPFHLSLKADVTSPGGALAPKPNLYVLGRGSPDKLTPRDGVKDDIDLVVYENYQLEISVIANWRKSK